MKVSTILFGLFTADLFIATVFSQDCLFGPCMNGGECGNNGCINCNGDYFGVTCQHKNTERCDDNQDCRHNGNCNGRKVCECKGHWYGPTCEVVCPGRDPEVCQNGGTCVPDPMTTDGFRCDCAVQYTGKFCERDRKACLQMDCNAGQQSSDDPRFCDCPPGYTGACCQGNRKACSKMDCVNGERNSEDPRFCDCPPGYRGSCCQDAPDVCTTGQCLNGGQLDDMGFCVCINGFRGPCCENPPPMGCDLDPCQNGGTCSPGGTSITCICSPDFAGAFCEDFVGDNCDSDPCVNGGSCVRQPGEPGSCECPPDFTGAFCEELVCPPNVCENGGTCEPVTEDISTSYHAGPYICICTDNYEGLHCENPTGGGGGTDVIVFIAAGAGAVLVIIVVVACCCLFCTVRRRKRNMHRSKGKAKRMEQDSPLSERSEKPAPRQNTYIEMAERKTMEFPRVNVTLMDHIGSGSFADVYKAQAYAIITPKKKSMVAVKVLKEHSTPNDKKDFMKELSLYKTLGRHQNVVNMLGCCTEQEPVYLIMEYLSKGNLLEHLRAIGKANSDDSYMNAPPEHKLTPSDLLKFGIDIAKGMEFIDSKKCVHRDLATRNVLLGKGLICKISDFGLARDVASSAEYEMKSKGRVPVRWLAPESLTHNIYTTKSDAWSFGIVMWEIVTLGSHPYPAMSPKEVMQGVLNGYRLPKPLHCTNEMYSIIEKCWEHEPSNRPSFTELRRELEELLELDKEYFQMEEFHQSDYVYLEPDASAAEDL